MTTPPELLTLLRGELDAIRNGDQFKALDDHGKWLFGAASAITLVATAAAAVGLAPMIGLAQFAYALALLLLSLALVIAGLSLVPRPIRWNPNNTADMERAIERYRTLHHRKSLAVRGSAAAFAGAIVFAAAAVLLARYPTLLMPDDVRFGYTMNETAAVHVSVTAGGLDAGEALEIRAGPDSAPNSEECASDESLPTRARVVADARGAASGTLEIVGAPTPLCVEATWDGGRRAVWRVPTVGTGAGRINFSYSVNEKGTLHVELTAVGLPAQRPLDMRIGPGVPHGEGCRLTSLLPQRARAVADDAGKASATLDLVAAPPDLCLNARWGESEMSWPIPLGPALSATPRP